MSLTNEHAALLIRAFKGISSNPDQCFSAFDVTKATRSLTDDNVKHHQVREFVHALFDQGLLDPYDRIDHTFWDTNTNQNLTVKLFVPPGGDPYAYDPDQVKMVKTLSDDDDDSDEPEVLLEDGDGNPLLTSVPASTVSKDDVQVVSVVDGLDDEVIKIHTKDSIVDKILNKVKTKLPKWWN